MFIPRSSVLSSTTEYTLHHVNDTYIHNRPALGIAPRWRHPHPSTPNLGAVSDPREARVPVRDHDVPVPCHGAPVERHGIPVPSHRVPVAPRAADHVPDHDVSVGVGEAADLKSAGAAQRPVLQFQDFGCDVSLVNVVCVV